MEFLQKGNLFLQGLHFPLQVQTCERSVVHILFRKEERQRLKEDVEVYGLPQVFISSEL